MSPNQSVYKHPCRARSLGFAFCDPTAPIYLTPSDQFPQLHPSQLAFIKLIKTPKRPLFQFTLPPCSISRKVVCHPSIDLPHLVALLSNPWYITIDNPVPIAIVLATFEVTCSIPMCLLFLSGNIPVYRSSSHFIGPGPETSHPSLFTGLRSIFPIPLHWPILIQKSPP